MTPAAAEVGSTAGSLPARLSLGRLTSSFRARLLLGIVFINILVLGAAVLVVVISENRRRQRIQEQVITRFNSAFTAEPIRGEVSVKRIVEDQRWSLVFRDAMILNKVLTADDVEKEAVINPLGAAHRDVTAVRGDEVVVAVRRAIADNRPVPLAGGLCLPIVSAGGEVVAGGWFQLAVSDDPRGPVLSLVGTLLASSLVFTVGAYLSLKRRFLHPIQMLSGAAHTIATGDYSARVPEQAGGSEMRALVAVFNSMAARVEGWQAELQAAVDRATAEARTKERALVQSSRLASIGTLAAGIAHEINNPLGGMLNAARRLRANATDAKQVEYLDLILDGLDRVQRTVRKVLDFAPKPVRPMPFQLEAAVSGARALVEHRLRKENVGFELRIQDRLPRVLGDAHEFQQVFLNFFINSLDAIVERTADRPPPGRIVVTLRRAVDAEGRAMVEAVVEDNGCGLDEAHLPQVFDPFFTHKTAPTATGLGMSICFAIVRDHGGTIDLWSRRDEGFRVTVRLPIAAEDA